MDIEQELKAMHRNMETTHNKYYVSMKQIGSIICLMQQGLGKKDRDLRIKVLRAWIAEPMRKLYGVDVTSTKNISGEIASYLIDQLRQPGNDEMTLSNYGYELIEETVNYVQADRNANIGTEPETIAEIPAGIST